MKKYILIYSIVLFSFDIHGQSSIIDELTGSWQFNKKVGTMVLDFKNKNSKIQIYDSLYLGEVFVQSSNEILFKVSSPNKKKITFIIIKIKKKKTKVLLCFDMNIENKVYRIKAKRKIYND